jgi:uncharacterized protein YlxW (UPF0749 family)
MSDDDTAGTANTGPSPDGGWRRLGRAAVPRGSRGQLVAALLCAVLGFGAVVQVRLVDSDDALRSARESDLVVILDNLSQRAARLQSEAEELRAARERLVGSKDQRRAALAEAEQRMQALGILAGTLPAVGPGITLTISDPRREVDSTALLDAVQELRDAGAEAMQLEGGRLGPGDASVVRVVASTSFVDRGRRVLVDGTPLLPPYRLLAVGEPRTMATALGIPGGVLESLSERGAEGTVAQRKLVRVSALRRPSEPEYARPAVP